MAWRIDEQLVRGEIDNRVRGLVTGRLWFLGREEPVTLELKGNALRDVAGHLIRFTNPTPRPGDPEALRGFGAKQRGVVGDITASRKVRVPDCTMEELTALLAAKKPFPWHWGNSLYLEWHGHQNGRVVIESASYQIEIEPERTWTMSEADERDQRDSNERAMHGFMERLSRAVAEARERVIEEELGATKEERDAEARAAGRKPRPEDDEDTPTTAAEAAADAEQARMDLLLDRVQARIARARAAGEKPDHERIMEEERERLRRERGEPAPAAPSAEDEAEHAAWITEMNAAAEEALQKMEEEKWENDTGGFGDTRWHPLVERCHSLTHRLLDQTRDQGWLGEEEGAEHPLRDLINGVMIAGGKLAGALGTLGDADEWPPDPLCAGPTLTRLKRARGHLRDALAGLGAADEQNLGDAEWRRELRQELNAILTAVRRLIAEVRAVLKLSEETGEE